MKKIKILMTVMFLCLGMVTMGWCLMISDPSAGDLNGSFLGDPGYDLLLASVDKNSDDFKQYIVGGGGVSEENENLWVNTQLTTDVNYLNREENVPYYYTNEIGVYAFQISSEPPAGYFVVKNARWIALFQNNSEYGWGVFNTNVEGWPAGLNLPDSDGTFIISHVTPFDGAAPVPEPATVLLLGFGLAGLAVFGRRKFKN